MMGTAGVWSDGNLGICMREDLQVAVLLGVCFWGCHVAASRGTGRLACVSEGRTAWCAGYLCIGSGVLAAHNASMLI